MASEDDCHPSKKQRIFGTFNEMITIHAGKDEVQFLVPKDLLCATSPFFKAACKPVWMKPEDKNIIRLPEDEPEIIQAMVSWIFNNVIPLYNEIWDGGRYARFASQECEAPDVSPWPFCVELYILGDKYGIQDLMNDAIDGLLNLWEGYFGHYKTVMKVPLKVVNYAYEKMGKRHESPICRLLVTMVCYDYSEEDWERHKGDCNTEILYDLMAEMIQGRDIETAERSPMSSFCSRFHQHTTHGDEFASENKCTTIKSLVDELSYVSP